MTDIQLTDLVSLILIVGMSINIALGFIAGVLLARLLHSY